MRAFGWQVAHVLAGGLMFVLAVGIAHAEKGHPGAVGGVEIHGRVAQDLRLDLGDRRDGDATTIQVDDPWVRLDVSGSLGERLEFFVRLVEVAPVGPGEEREAAGGTASLGLLDEAHVTARLGPELSLTAGRQNVSWTLLQERVLDENPVFGQGAGQPGFTYFTAPAVHLSFAPGAWGMGVYYTPGEEPAGLRFLPFSREQLGARVTWAVERREVTLSAGGAAVVHFRDDRSHQRGTVERDTLGWGVQASAVRAGLGGLYAEYGQPDADRGDRFWLVGARLDLLESAGLSGFVERDLTNDEMAFEVSKELNPYVRLIVGGDTKPDSGPGDDEWRLYAVSRFGMDF